MMSMEDYEMLIAVVCGLFLLLFVILLVSLWLITKWNNELDEYLKENDDETSETLH